MEFVINIIIFLNLFHNLFSVIPNWNLTAVGENLMTSDTYIKTVEMSWYNNEVKLEVFFTKENGTIKKKEHSKVTINSESHDVEFDDIQSFYEIHGQFYICPKGNFHVYDFYANKHIIPEGFKDKEGTKFELKCQYQKEAATFIVFYLMNAEYSMYVVYIKDGERISNMQKMNFFPRETYDFKMRDDESSGNKRYIMLTLIKDGEKIKISRIEATLDETEQNFGQAGQANVGEMRKYVQAYFKVFKANEAIKTNDFFYISYNNISDFWSGYTTFAPPDYSYESVGKTKVNSSNASFEFFEDVEIEEMNFLPYNRYVYYKMKNKNDSSTVYYGIYDTKLYKVIFNTDEKLNYYMPFSDREMLAVTDSSVYKICAIKDENNDCTDYCSNNYLLYTQGNKCNETLECKPGEVMLVPSMVCNQTCDENIYYSNGTHCGLCKHFFKGGNEFKLIGLKECIGQKENDTMEYYSERLNLLKCKEGYYLKNETCVKNVTCFERCESCEEEPIGIHDQRCSSCKSNYLLENGNCVDNCSPGRGKIPIADNKYECKYCGDDQCKEFELNTCNCQVCKYEHFFVNSNKTCESCDENCGNCIETSTKCTSCLGRKFLYNDTCYVCEDNSKCENFFDGGCECEKCKDGFYNLNHQCKSCINNCKTCSNSSECEICQDNYFLNSTGQCSECPTTCATKKSDNCQCETCIEGYFMNSSEKCEECDTTKCKNCEGNADNCTECKENYFFNELKECEQCDEKCKTCSKEKSNCTSCDDGFFLTTENKCGKCDNKCYTCSGSEGSECLSCNTSDEYKYLIFDDYNKTCVKNCSESGRELSEINFECKPLKKNNGTDENKQTLKGSADYLLWIFIAIFGVLLIIITICIIKKCCCNKPTDIEEEISQELSEKDEIIA